MFGTPGVHLTDDDIANMPYASQYVQLNGGPQLFVVLAFDGKRPAEMGDAGSGGYCDAALPHT